MLFKSQTQNYRILLLTLFFLVINSIAGASGTWKVIKHVRGADWQDVFFLDKSHGWAVGNYGAVISTENGGKDWKILQRKPERFDLPQYEAVHFITESKGWIVGRGSSGNGVILFTEDKGKRLEEQASLPGTYLYDVKFISQSEGWVVGERVRNKQVLILHTENGGENWEVQEENESGRLRRLFFIDKKKGFAAGRSNTTPLLLQTKDGGKTWNKRAIPIEGHYISDIFFLNPMEGWIILNGSLFKTVDVGTSWQKIPNPQEGVSLERVWFKDSKKGFFLGIDFASEPKKFFIGHTEDGGQSFDWRRDFSFLEDIACSGKHCWAVGYDNTILHTDGKDCNLQVERVYSFRDVDFVKKDRVFLLGAPNHAFIGSAIFSTRDGGKHWATESRVLEELNCLDFIDDSFGWIGSDQGLYYTEDKGVILQEVDELSGYDIIDIEFPEKNQGWLLAWKISVWQTSDNGKTWQKTRIDVGVDEGVSEIDVFNQKAIVLGWKGRGEGIVLYTENERKEFRKVKVEESMRSGGVFFGTEDAGWIVGNDGAIFHTENGGKSWEKQESGTDKYLKDVLFLSEKEGWAVGEDGVILHTTDGGNSWTEQKCSSKETLRKIAYTGSNYLLTVGDWSTVLKYTDESLTQFAVSDQRLQPVSWGEIKNCLYQNYPNPFNPETWIPYQLSKSTDVTFFIYNSQGKLVRKISLGYRQAGVYLNKKQSVYWNGRNDNGEEVSSGIYFYTIFAGNFIDSKKMLLLR